MRDGKDDMRVSNTREAVVTSRGFDWGIAVEYAYAQERGNRCRSSGRYLLGG